MVMAVAAGIRLFFNPTCRYTQPRGNKLKCMAVFMPHCPRHMAGDTAAERMNSMGRSSLQCYVAIHTEAVRSKLCHGNFYVFFLMNTMAVRAHNSCLCMYTCLPFIVLLVMFFLFLGFFNVKQI